ncbi:hypothetical protein IV417_08150 [Alphaproteobacteria bacterium KMM 3653]|uniref:Dihydroxy-acid dehydratase n=1 Tax=Harenicola maris TaxID=2841044 RepID=A0AAP2CN54_9RHOB|nr:hypothetical protein [Harenicola maris]
MFIWTSSLRALGAACVLTALVGCFGDVETKAIEESGVASQTGEAAPGAAARSPVQGTREVAVAEGAVTVAGPDGYCIDTGATKDRKRGAFVLLASCASVLQSASAYVPVTNALLTVSVGGEGSADLLVDAEASRAYFASAAGRAALSRDGKAESVVVESAQVSGDFFLVQTLDSSGKGPDGLGPRTWRAFFDQGGRAVVASVIGYEERALEPTAAFDLLRRFAGTIQSKSGGARPATRNVSEVGGGLPQAD